MSERPSDIAIVGMSCVFPGAADLTAYWNNILAKVDAVSDPPPDWGADLFYDEDSAENDRTYCKKGGWLSDLATFDPVALGVMPNAVDGGEPDHFLALQAAYDALQDAGYNSDLMKGYKERCEVIIGRGTYVNRGNATAIQQVLGIDSLLRALKRLHPEYDDEQLRTLRQELKASLPAFNSDTSAALVPNIISGRIANRLDLMGANYIVDAACASSLVAVDHAVHDLQTGRCDLAVAGGVHASTPPVILVIFSHLKALSRSGTIRPFDARADGTLLGEGVGMVVLKRLEDAERDCDRVYALIKGVGIASDGKALGLLAPRVEGEMLAIKRAYEASGVSVGTVELIEAHGTGTLVGDATELDALNQTFGARVGAFPDIAIGSVKSMISHTMPASGIAGIIKSALALHHKVLPPTICEEPHPALLDPKSRFYLNTEARPWIRADKRTPRRAGVNAFGFGGINAHAVLEEYRGEHPAPWLQTQWESELFVLSGDTQSALADRGRQLLAEVQGSPQFPLAHLAWSTNCTRELQRERLAIVASSKEDLEKKLTQAIERFEKPDVERIKMRGGVYYSSRRLADQGGLALMFPGEGAQYPGMLRDIAIHFPEVRGVFELVDAAFENHQRGRLPSQVVFQTPGAADSDLIWSMDAGAEAVFCANQAVLRLLQELSIVPDSVVGHSTGEHSALIAAGVVKTQSDEDFIDHVLGVNQVFEKLSSKIPEATLVAVGGAERERLKDLVGKSGGQIFIALDNCANQVVLCGSPQGVDSLIHSLADDNVVCQRLPMARAYHTPWFNVFSEPLRAYFDRVDVSPPSIPIYSCVTAEPFPNDADEARRLISVSWSNTVRFRDTIEKIYEDGVRIFVESGPRGNLSGFVGDILKDREHLAVPADIRRRSGLTQLQHMLAQLVAHGVNPKLEYLYRYRSADIKPKAASLRRLKIASGLQPMRLSDDRPLAPAHPPAAVFAPAPLPTAETVRPSSPPAARQCPEPPVSPRPAGPPPRPFATPVPASSFASRSDRGRVAEAYLSNMERFLDVQYQVVSSYLKLRGRSSAVQSPAAAPFVDRVVQNGEAILAYRRLSLERDRFLLDHTFGRNISAADPSLTALAVVPLTVTMEILAEAGALLEPGKAFVGMRDLRASQWLTLEAGEIDLELEATKEAAGEVRVRARRTGDSGQTRPVLAEAVVSFADSLPIASTRPKDLPEARPSAWRPEELYQRGMFHGASFQAVTRMASVAPGGCTASLEVLPRKGLIEGVDTPQFLTDPIILDAAGQVVAFWSQEVLQPNADIFPYALDHLECFSPPPPPGSRLECRVFANRVDPITMAVDIDIVDGQERLIYRLKNWADRRFEPPRSFWDLRIAPSTTFLSSPAELWLGPWSNDADLACVTLQAFPESFYEASHGVWRQSLAAIVLGRGEREKMLGAKALPARRREWLTGRIAVKDAVRRLLQRKFGVTPPYADIEIVAGESGALSAHGSWRGRFSADVSISLSHSQGFAVAIAALGARRAVGVDIEPIDRDAAEVQQLAFNGAERELLAQVSDPQDRDRWSLRLWCAKEAVGKAMRTGLGPAWHDLEIVRLDPKTGEVEIASKSGGMRYTSYSSLVDGFVFAAVVDRP